MHGRLLLQTYKNHAIVFCRQASQTFDTGVGKGTLPCNYELAMTLNFSISDDQVFNSLFWN